MECERLDKLTAGMAIPYGGDRIARVSEELAAAFAPGDRLIVVQETGDLLRVPGPVFDLAASAVTQALEAFEALRRVSPAQVTDFFDRFAAKLEDDSSWARIAEANAADVADAKRRGRSTTRLVATPKMRAEMIAGLRQWRDAPPAEGRLVERSPTEPRQARVKQLE